MIWRIACPYCGNTCDSIGRDPMCETCWYKFNGKKK